MSQVYRCDINNKKYSEAHSEILLVIFPHRLGRAKK